MRDWKYHRQNYRYYVQSEIEYNDIYEHRYRPFKLKIIKYHDSISVIMYNTTIRRYISFPELYSENIIIEALDEKILDDIFIDLKFSHDMIYEMNIVNTINTLFHLGYYE